MAIRQFPPVSVEEFKRELDANIAQGIEDAYRFSSFVDRILDVANERGDGASAPTGEPFIWKKP
jgi:hypothetical protein